LLVYTPKKHSKQYIGLEYVIYIEMTDYKFSLTSQCHRTTVCISCLEKKKAIWPGIIQ